MREQTRVLIVDDDAVTLMLVANAMSDAGHEALEADSGEAAIALLKECLPDIILLDLQMPGMGGLAFCRWLRAQALLSTLPVLVMTGLDNSATIESAFDAGASDFIAKPFNFSILSHRVRFLLRARTNLLALERSRRNLADAQVIARLGSWELDRASGEAICSDQLFKVLDRDPANTEPTIANFIAGVHPAERPGLKAAIEAAVSQQQPLEHIFRFVARNGQPRWIHLRVRFDYDDSGRAVRSHGTVQDITEQRGIEARIDYLTRHDSSTGLPNRSNFLQRLGASLALPPSHGNIATLRLALDRYHLIRDSLGPEAVDMILRQASQRLLRCVRDSEPTAFGPPERHAGTVLARWGGDEFILMMPGQSGPQDAIRLARVMLEKLRRPFRIGEHEIKLDAHIGVAMSPIDGSTASALTHASSVATSHARNTRMAEPQFYSAELNADARLRLRLERDLRQALSAEGGDELILHYQPQFDHHGRIHAAEALLRWQHPTLGLLPPGQFIPLAEESGLIIVLGIWVIRTVCRQLRQWSEAGLQNVTIAINLASPHFLDPGLLPLLDEVTQANGIDPRQIELELTESMVMEDSDLVRNTLARIHERGFLLSIDDFGTGFSSLRHLSFLPLDTLKIDRSFIQNMLEGPRQAAVVRGIIALAKSLGLRVVAEGVETQEQASAVRHEGCDLMQGFLHARPMPAETFALRLKD